MIQFFQKFIRDESGVSAVFGALLLLAVLSLFFSAFLLTAVPAQIMAEESDKNEQLLSDILKLSENPASSGRSSFHSQYASVHTETGGGIIFCADLSVPAETKSFLEADDDLDSLFPGIDFGARSEMNFGSDSDSDLDSDSYSNLDSDSDSDPDFDSDSDSDFDSDSGSDFYSASDSNFDSDLYSDFVPYQLSSGSLLFSCRYSQLPDCVYSSGDSSLLLIQNEGFSFLKPPSVSVRRGGDGGILLSLSGDLVHFTSSPAFGNLTVLDYRVVQTADVHDFVSFVCVRYVPPASSESGILNEVSSAKKAAFALYFSQLNDRINRDFPELESEFDSKNLILTISSSSSFEIDVRVREIEYDFS
ncbi:hypothetical protein [Methanimicrococcus hacksteinii]|nr:hypothetical protein [Methanimicrococcus sp. At1]